MDRREFLRVGVLVIAGVLGAVELRGPSSEQPSIINDEFQQALDNCYQRLLDWGLPDDVPVVLIVAPEVKEICFSDVDIIKVLGRTVTVGINSTIFVAHDSSEVWLVPQYDEGDFENE